MGGRSCIVVLAAWACGCGSSETEPLPSTPPPPEHMCPPGETQLEDGSCLAAGRQPDGCAAGETFRDGSCVPAGVQADGCAAGEHLQDGVCVPAGVPPEACGNGFVSDGNGGCEAILPSAPCGDGLMAVPGESSCHPVATCGQGAWGDIPVDSTTEHVDASYTGGSSDGSAGQPWTTIAEAVAAAAPGAIVAVAAGSYGYTLIDAKPVRLWGRCPELVEVVGPTDKTAAVLVADGASGSVVRGIATTGPVGGIAVSGSEQVVVEEVWIHDTEFCGFLTTPDFGATSVTLRRSLVERALETGVYVAGSAVVIEASAVRDSVAGPNAEGLGLLLLYQNTPATVTVQGSLIERNMENGAAIVGSNATFVDSVVRDTLLEDGAGILAVPSNVHRSSVTLRSSVLATNHDAALVVAGSDGHVEASVLRDTLSSSGGRGLSAESVGTERAVVAIEQSLIDKNPHAGVSVAGSDATLRSVLVRETQAAAPMGESSGVGVVAGPHPVTGGRSQLTVMTSKIAENLDAGILVLGSDATIEGSLIADTRTSAGATGITVGIASYWAEARANVTVDTSVIERTDGIGVRVDDAALLLEATLVKDTRQPVGMGAFAISRNVGEPSLLEFRRSVVEQCYTACIFGEASQVVVDATAVRDIALDPDTNSFGDGILVQNEGIDGPPSTLTVSRSTVEKMRGVGIAVIGSEGSIAGTHVHDGLESATKLGPAGGIFIQAAFDLPSTVGRRASGTVVDSLLESCEQTGMLIGGADVVMDHSVVRFTRPVNDVYGDGVSAGALAETHLTITGSRLEGNARAGLSNFGSSVELGTTILECNAIDIHGEEFEGAPFAFSNRGDNACGCQPETWPCKVLTAHLEPPLSLAH